MAIPGQPGTRRVLEDFLHLLTWRELPTTEGDQLTGEIAESDMVAEMTSRLINGFRAQPCCSRTTVQHFVGANCSPRQWEPVLNHLNFLGQIRKFEVILRHSNMTRRILYVLADYPFPPVTLAQLQELQDKAAKWDAEHPAPAEPEGNTTEGSTAAA